MLAAQKVLIVEDDFMIADCLEEILLDAGFQVCGIASGLADAMSIGEEHRPDLAIIDLCLAHGRYGTEIASALRLQGAIGVLYVSGNPDHLMLSEAEGDACMAKPYSASSIVAALRIVDEKLSKLARLSAFPPGFRLLEV